MLLLLAVRTNILLHLFSSISFGNRLLQQAWVQIDRFPQAKPGRENTSGHLLPCGPELLLNGTEKTIVYGLGLPLENLRLNV